MLQDSPAAHLFIDKVIEAKGLDSLEEEVRHQLHADLLHQLEEIISRNVIDRIPKTKLPSFMHIMDSNEPESINEFLKKEGIDIHEVLARSMGELQTRYLTA